MAIKTMIDLTEQIDLQATIARALPLWRPILAKECQVYVYEEGYIAKRFDQIHYTFCDAGTAKEILIDNLYALLRFKYFKETTEEIDDRISEIIKSFTVNLKTTLQKLTFDSKTDGVKVSMLPSYCAAFKNGVYNFKTNSWLFKYTVVNLTNLNNKLYLYDYNYVVLWYFNFDFEPLDIDINKFSLEEFLELMKDLEKDNIKAENRNYCFELVYNMSHDELNKFSMKKFIHLCEILGYNMCQEFVQAFVMLIGSGGNGKNSLFDGCFTCNIVPRPTSNSLDDIENDSFISGTLVNHYQNIFLETSPKTYTESKNLKNFTGSPFQTINIKGIQKHQSYINCKFTYAANDQEMVKFSDTTQGFRRRGNFFEVWFSWTADKRFLKTGDYYDTSFSQDLREITSNLANAIIFVYLGMYGIKLATKNFTSTFNFTENDWKLQYADVDISVDQSMQNISIFKVVDYLKSSTDALENTFFDREGNKLYKSPTMIALGYNSQEKMLKMIADDECRTSYFADNDVFISTKALYKICGYTKSQFAFTQSLKKIYNLKSIEKLSNNQAILRCTFVGKKFKLITI